MHGALGARRPGIALLAAVCTAVVAATVPVATPALAGSASPRPASGVLDAGLPTVGAALQEVVVTARGGVDAAADAVRRVGGTLEEQLQIVGGVSADVPAAHLMELAGTPGVTAVTADREGRFDQLTYGEEGSASAFVASTRATKAWAGGHLGAGVGVAVLDTGISPMNDLNGRLVHGPDLSGEGTLIDTFGHGTVMAGVIGGSGADSAGRTGGAYTGVAPKAHLVAVKVAGRNGVVDVSTMLQAMHWVSAYRAQLGIRVLNLSWGTTSTQDPAHDPLNYAVQRLWRDGIVVVVGAGNAGPHATTITKPADDPLVVSVGAYDDKGNSDPADDALAAWSSRGPTAQRLSKPDVVTPGRSLVAARSYGSQVEATYPKALISPSYIRGSGTSQAAAVTSGLAALLLSARPELTPDQVKHLLKTTASPLLNKTVNEQGAGRVDLAAALVADAGPAYWQTATATGLGSLEASRGGRNVVADCQGTATVIVGEIDVYCQPFDPAAWTASSWSGDAWTGTSWNGTSWNGTSWNGTSWNGTSWNGTSWNGGTWIGTSWNGTSWNGTSWNGTSWNGTSWNGTSWNGTSWNGNSWTTAEYEEFLTAWWGAKPPFGTIIPGEQSEARPTGLSHRRWCQDVLDVC